MIYEAFKSFNILAKDTSALSIEKNTATSENHTPSGIWKESIPFSILAVYVNDVNIFGHG